MLSACVALFSRVPGMVIRRPKFQFGRGGYGYIMLLVAFSIILSSLLSDVAPHVGVGLLAFASGLQNAMCSVFSGLIVRTTHFTGMMTDLGVLTARFIYTRGQTEERWKFKIFLPLIFSFVFGAAAGDALFYVSGFYSLYLPSAILFITAGVYLTSEAVKVAGTFLQCFLLLTFVALVLSHSHNHLTEPATLLAHSFILLASFFPPFDTSNKQKSIRDTDRPTVTQACKSR
jgi:uncharacterized membrane protein YoaK (UPF0700 family)